MERDIGRMQWTTGAVILGALVVGGMAYASQADVLPKIQSGITKALIAKPDVVINENDPKWIEKGNYGENGRFLMDKDGNAVVYAIDKSKPIVLTSVPEQTKSSEFMGTMKTLTYLNKVELIGDMGSFFGVGDFDLGREGYTTVLTSINGLNLWDTSKVTNMSYMFYNLSELKQLDVSNWNTSNVTLMSSMFYKVGSLELVDVSKWDLSKVTSIYAMFGNMGSLVSLNLSNWNTSKVTNMAELFIYDGSLTSIGDVSKWDVSNVSDMNNMFAGVSNLKMLDVSKWNTVKLESMSSTFSGLKSLLKLDVSNWNTSKVTTMYSALSGLQSLTELDVSKWNTSNVTDMSDMFYNQISLKTLDLSKWNTSKVTDMGNMFSGYYPNLSLVSVGDISKWDLSSNPTMLYMFDKTSIPRPNWFVNK